MPGGQHARIRVEGTGRDAHLAAALERVAGFAVVGAEPRRAAKNGLD